MIGNPIEYEKMAKVESELWWYNILHDITLNAIQKRFGKNKNIRILDAGCGTGGLLIYLSKKGYENIQGFDLSLDAVRFSNDKGLNVKQGNLLDSEILIKECFDVIISNDTFCYLSDDEIKNIMITLESKLNFGGIIILNLPAFNSFGGIHDKAVGIIHRFNRTDLKKIKLYSGLKLDYYRFWPFSLSPLIYFTRLKQRVQMKYSAYNEKSDIILPNFIINKLLYWMVRFEIKIIKSGPFGSSIQIIFLK